MMGSATCPCRMLPAVESTHHTAIYCLDRLLAAVLLVSSAPLIAFAALITFYLCRRSPFVAHLRVGRGGRSFWMLKLRTMWGGEARRSPALLVERVEGNFAESKGPDDRRVCSSLARMCRKFSLDELPQLVHVVAGEMSLVGPRPITRAEL